MTNFLEFINEDIEIKKTLISTLPTKTKVDRNGYIKKITTISEKYSNYRNSVKDYLTVKSKSFVAQQEPNDIPEITKELEELSDIDLLLNPTNGYFQKMKFDELLYQIKNYSNSNFNSLNNIIIEFINKFELAGINLNAKDFTYTCYVNEYMSIFLETYFSKEKDYKKVTETFEKIYWTNSDIIKHVEINFRKLIAENEKKFNNYINDLKTKINSEKNIITPQDCLKKIESCCIRLSDANNESINDIIELAKTGKINVKNYFEDSKIRLQNIDSFTINKIDLKEKESLNQLYKDISKLKISNEEYQKFKKFTPIFTDYQKRYESKIGEKHKSEVKNLLTQITKKEKKLAKLNKKVFNLISTLNNQEGNKALNDLKIDSIKLANELYYLYDKCDQEYFNDKMLGILSKTVTVSELMNLYYSYDYFKKTIIKEVFSLKTYEEIEEYSKEFDCFVRNPLNVITDSALVFEKKDLGEIIVNKYRLSNIDITNETLEGDELEERISYILRIKKIDSSSITFEKIWFMAEVEKLLKEE